MKKTTEKSSTPTAAAKVPGVSTKPAAAATKPTKKSAAPAALTKSPAATAQKATQAAARKKPGVVTRIAARIDVGHGNRLFLRGAGPGLSWDCGLAMQCVGPNLWALTLKAATLPIPFKVLINDLCWSEGEDFVAAPGADVTVVPAFPGGS